MQAPDNRWSLDAYLRSAKDLARLSAHAHRLLMLQQTYARIAPHYLAEASQVANCKSGKVVIHAASGAVAAKINQLAPSLRDEFCKRGCEVTEIAARVQVRAAMPGRARPTAVREIPGPAIRSIARLNDSLPDDSPLREALTRLLEHSRNGRKDPLQEHQHQQHEDE